MPVIITGNNTPTAGGITYGDGSTYANTAAGTSGQPVVSGGAGAPVFRPYTLPASDGSASQVLQTNGSGALSFATPSTGALVLLSTVTASASATVDIETTFNSTYDVYLLVINNIIMATGAGGELRMRMKLGGTYDTGANYAYHTLDTNSNSALYAATVASTDTSILVSANIYNNSDNGFGLSMYIYRPAGTANAKSVSWDGGGKVYLYSRRTSGIGHNNGTTALTGLRFFGGSNFSSGTFRLYGLANS
jgi:hypothetical protein